MSVVLTLLAMRDLIMRYADPGTADCLVGVTVGGWQVGLNDRSLRDARTVCGQCRKLGKMPKSSSRANGFGLGSGGAYDTRASGEKEQIVD
jgi:hypothetical protein